MNKIMILLVLFTLGACSTTAKKPNVKIIQGTPIEEVELPISTVDFPKPEQVLANENLFECKDEYLFFLIREPFNGFNLLKGFYDDSLQLNQNMKKLIELSIQVRNGKISIEDYRRDSYPINKEMNDINNEVEGQLKKYGEIEYKSQAFYPVCQERFVEMMKTRKIDPNQDGCELQQQQGYLIDPYLFKPAVNEAIRTELLLNKYLTELYKVVYDEIYEQKPHSQAKKEFLEIADQLKKSGLKEKSFDNLERVVNSFKSTMSIKEACEATEGK